MPLLLLYFLFVAFLPNSQRLCTSLSFDTAIASKVSEAATASHASSAQTGRKRLVGGSWTVRTAHRHHGPMPYPTDAAGPWHLLAHPQGTIQRVACGSMDHSWLMVAD